MKNTNARLMGRKTVSIISAVVMIGAYALSPAMALAAAWTATDDFESYSLGNLNGDNGGTGWGGAWLAANTNRDAIVVSSPAIGSRALLLPSDTDINYGSPDISRTLATGATSKIYRVYVYASSTPTGTKGFYPTIFRESGSTQFLIAWGAPGSSGNTISFGNNISSWAVLSTTASSSTWYPIEVEFQKANNRARASFNGGAWSAWVTPAQGTFNKIDSIRLTTADGNTVDQGYYVDSIGPGV
jgi:hypothetical protein